MGKRVLLIIWCLLYWCCEAADNTGKYVITCPAIQLCQPNDGPKKNLAYAKVNQQAYDCFRSMGQSDLANQAFSAKTKCQAIYGSTNATIGNDHQAVSADKN